MPTCLTTSLAKSQGGGKAVDLLWIVPGGRTNNDSGLGGRRDGKIPILPDSLNTCLLPLKVFPFH